MVSIAVITLTTSEETNLHISQCYDSDSEGIAVTANGLLLALDMFITSCHGYDLECFASPLCGGDPVTASDHAMVASW